MVPDVQYGDIFRNIFLADYRDGDARQEENAAESPVYDGKCTFVPAAGLHLPRKYSKINSGMLKIRNRITKVATSIRRIIVENLSAFSKLMV